MQSFPFSFWKDGKLELNMSNHKTTNNTY